MFFCFLNNKNNNVNDDEDDNYNKNRSSVCLAQILVFCNDVNDDDSDFVPPL